MGCEKLRESLLEGASRPVAGNKRGKSGRGKSGRGNARSKDQAVGGLWRRIRPKTALLSLCCVGVGGAILVNAVFLQPEKHPAPFFAKQVPPAQRVVARTEPLPARRPADLDTIDRPVRQTNPLVVVRHQAPARTGNIGSPVLPMPAERTAQRPPELPRRTPTAMAKPSQAGPARDLIGSLITGGVSSIPRPPAEIPQRARTAQEQGEKEAARRKVEAVQRALVKLGYKLDVDGLAGPATRAAIEKFERANRLPVTGRAEGRTLQALTARSRVAVAR